MGTVAIIFDFDETLGPDTISFLLESQGKDPQEFWNHVKSLVEEGFDPPLAYMHLLSEGAKHWGLDLSPKTLQKIGKKIPLFSGLPQMFGELSKFVAQNESLRNARVRVEYYIVSGGLEEIIRASKIGPHMHGIFGSNFFYDKKGTPLAIRSAVSFTEKTRFIFAINKGLTEKEARTNPYRINDALSEGERRIPFTQMIYIGDGPSDIPCLSLITTNGGAGIGVSSPAETFQKGYELARGKRITVGPYTANYKSGSDLRKVLEETILRIGLGISEDSRKKRVPAPSHS